MFDNPTVEASVNSTLVSILGREAAIAHTTLTMDEVVRANRKLEPNLEGLES